jgi:excisionase family DNA binding protein
MTVKETQNKRTSREHASKKEITSRMLTVPQAATYLSLPVSQVRKLIWAGDVSVIRRGKGYILDIYDLDAWIEDTKQPL